MEPIKSFEELAACFTESRARKKMAVANAVDDHTLEAVMMAVDKGVVEAYLVGEKTKVESMIASHLPSPYVHIIDIADVLEATMEAVRLVKSGECDILMKGLVNTDVVLREVLNKERGLLPAGRVLTYNALLNIPGYHKLVFFTDPAVIPAPTKEQRIEMIKYSLESARKFGISSPNVALLHATEKANPKIAFMQDYLDILDMWKEGYFGECTIDGPMDAFLALDKERGAIKKVPSPILGEADILMFPDFAAANSFYKGLVTFAGASMAGMLQGTEKPVVLTSRSDDTMSKFNSICMAAVVA